MGFEARVPCLRALAFIVICSLLGVEALSFGNTSPRKPHWTDHPVIMSNSAVKPPICVLYTTRSSGEEWSVQARGMLARRSSKYLLADRALEGTEEASQLLDYDVLQFSTGQVTDRKNALQIETTRDSKVCLLMTVSDSRFKMSREATMKPPPGYSFIGAVRWSDDLGPREDPEGSGMTHTFQGLAACKLLKKGTHDFPSPDILGAEYNVRKYSLLFAEIDGKAPEAPSMPPGWSEPVIKPYKRCPDALHDMWMVDNHDLGDPDTAGKKWHSWHPQKDYVYDCYYGHEHGTPGMLAGYTERLDYTAWKNSRQDESHDGFKSYVMPVPGEDVFLVVNLHADTSDIGRVDKEFHTMIVAVTQKESGKHLFELSCKASSGGSACDYKNRPSEGLPFLPVGNAEAQRLVSEAYGEDRRSWVNHRKRVNCWTPNSFNPNLRTRDGTPSLGHYEGWFMKTQGEMCMYSPDIRRSAGPEVDIKNPQTGKHRGLLTVLRMEDSIASVHFSDFLAFVIGYIAVCGCAPVSGCASQDCREAVILGRRSEDGMTVTRPSIGTNRQIRFKDLSIGPDHCMHELPAPGPDGYITFYTNPTCTELCSGPDSNCVRQLIHSSFKGFNISGRFEVSDVHGHNMYELAEVDGIRKSGLHGISEVEGGISMEL